MILDKVKSFILEHTEWGRHRYLNSLYDYDRRCFQNFSSQGKSNVPSVEAEIRILSHTIEKALSLPDCRPGFGKEKILRLLFLINKYKELTGKQDNQLLQMTYATIKAYILFQEENNFDLSFIPKEYDSLASDIKAGVMNVSAPSILCSFETIANQRHSLRYYSTEPIKEEDIFNCVKIAQTAPSACNRQSVNVFACTNPTIIDKILELHRGTRGFGKPSVVFAITGDLSLYINELERNTVFVDGGIFCMNLLYALSDNGIGCCPVIWGGDPSDDKRLREWLNIPQSHRIVILVLGGYYPEGDYRVACSPKRDVETILKIIK